MEVAQRLIYLLVVVASSYGQRIPQTLFEPIVVTEAQESRIYNLNTLTSKTQEQREELAKLYAETGAYLESFSLLETLAEETPASYEYQFLLGGISGILATNVSRVKSLPYVRTMKTAFETAVLINPDTLDLQLIMLELYTELPWILGGSNKKAEQSLKNIKSLSVIEGYLASGYFNQMNNKNKQALVSYLNAVNEVQGCSEFINATNNAHYRLGVLAYYLQKDIPKAQCLFERYIENHSTGDSYPKSFAQYYLTLLINPALFEERMQEILVTYDLLTAWIQNNFK